MSAGRKLLLAIVLVAHAGTAIGAEPTDRFYAYQLDNMSTVHALGVLETLGYSVIYYDPDVEETISDLPRPVVVELPDSQAAVSSLIRPGNTDLGGNPLAGPTAGQPHQRLMIVWNGDDPDSLETLLGLLQEQIDLRAKQILIEAVVLEIDRDRIQELGVNFEGGKDGQSFSFLEKDGLAAPFTYVFRRPSVKTLLDLDVTIDALVTRGDANLLSRPSVMVLDGRQARIKVGDNLPVTSVAASTLDLESQIVTGTEYIPTGITLNLRPRASEDGSEVTMQVETLISTPAGPSIVVPQTGTLLGPQIRTREVQTLVRVADDTPFIIGGLIAEDDRSNRSGIPWLSEIPVVGALFRRTNEAFQTKEVIIVITPHVLPLVERSFRYSVHGKDYEKLDQFDLELFRNLYRIKSEDVFDLDFVYDSELYEAMRRAADLFGGEFERRAIAAGWAPVPPGDRAALAAQVRRAIDERPAFLDELERDYPGLEVAEPLVHLIAGGVPGEEILIERMLLEIIEKLDFGRHVDPESITFFHLESEDEVDSLESLEIEPLLPRVEALGKGCHGETLRLVFPTHDTALGPHGTPVRFDPPGAVVDRIEIGSDREFLRELRRLNGEVDANGDRDLLGLLIDGCHEIRGHSALDVLRSVLVLKRLLDINPSLPLTLDTFHPGREVVFPSVETLEARTHVVDRKVAELFFETTDYFYAFEQVYQLAYRTIRALAGTAGSVPPEAGEPAAGGD